MSMYSTISLFGFEQQFTYAGVAELADALALGASVSDVQVQVLSPAPYRVFITDLSYGHSIFCNFEFLRYVLSRF